MWRGHSCLLRLSFARFFILSIFMPGTRGAGTSAGAPRKRGTISIPKRTQMKPFFACLLSALLITPLAHPAELAPVLNGEKVTALLCELTHFPERELFQEVAKYSVQSVWITHYPDHLVRRESEIKLIAREEKFRGEVHLMHDRVAHDI